MPSDAICELVDRLAALPGADDLFNPYAPLDDPDAAIRRANLIRYLTALQRFKPTVLLLAEAPGYRGCRYSGLPVVSERIMLEGVEKWGLFGDGFRATSGVPNGISEMTATILWGALVEHLDKPPVIWNTVPLHPHRPGQPDTNRAPRLSEIRMGQPFVEAIMAMFPIRTVLAVGRKAERTLQELGIEHTYLRHPSQGGKADFIAGLKQAVGGDAPA